MKVKTTEIRQRRHEIHMSADEVREALIDAATSTLGLRIALGQRGTLTCTTDLDAGIDLLLIEELTGEAEAVPTNMQDPHIAPAPAPADPLPQTTNFDRDPWTSAEDDLLVAKRSGPLRDVSMAQASRDLHALLPNRTPKAIMLRMQRNLAPRIEAAMDAADLAKLSEGEPEPVSPPADPEPEPAPVAPVTALPLWQIELNARLDKLGYRQGWSADEDYELVTLLCTGWKLGDAAARIHRDHGPAMERWQALVRCTTGAEFRALRAEEQSRLATALKARIAK